MLIGACDPMLVALARPIHAAKAPTLWGGAEGFIARSDDDCDMEVQSGSEWLGMRYSGM